MTVSTVKLPAPPTKQSQMQPTRLQRLCMRSRKPLMTAKLPANPRMMPVTHRVLVQVQVRHTCTHSIRPQRPPPHRVAWKQSRGHEPQTRSDPGSIARGWTVCPCIEHVIRR